MPTRLDHHFSHSNDVIIGHVTVKEVAHRIDKDHLRSLPADWLNELFRHKAQIKALFIRMAFNSTKAFSKCFGVAASASRADFGASANRVPCSICPLDLRVIAHFGGSIGLRGTRDPQFYFNSFASLKPLRRTYLIELRVPQSRYVVNLR